MWNKDSDKILTAADNGKIFDVSTGECLQDFNVNSNKVTGALWANDDKHIILSESEKCMTVFNLDGEPRTTFNTNYFLDPVISRETNFIAYYTGSKIIVYDYIETKQI